MAEDIKKTFSNNLKKIRKSKGLTQEDLASRIGVKQPSYNRWEAGNIWPEEDTVNKIAQALDIDQAILFFDESLITPQVATKVLSDYFNK